MSKAIEAAVRRQRLLLEERWMSAQEVADVLGISKMSVYRMCERDELEYIRAGRLVRIRAYSLEQWLYEGGTKEPDEVTYKKLAPRLKSA